MTHYCCQLCGHYWATPRHPLACEACQAPSDRLSPWPDLSREWKPPTSAQPLHGPLSADEMTALVGWIIAIALFIYFLGPV